jgi:hypothetical protein
MYQQNYTLTFAAGIAETTMGWFPRSLRTLCAYFSQPEINRGQSQSLTEAGRRILIELQDGRLVGFLMIVPVDSRGPRRAN